MALKLTDISELGAITAAGNVLPSADYTYNLGGSGSRWNFGYFNNTVHISDGNLTSNGAQAWDFDQGGTFTNTITSTKSTNAGIGGQLKLINPHNSDNNVNEIQFEHRASGTAVSKIESVAVSGGNNTQLKFKTESASALATRLTLDESGDATFTGDVVATGDIMAANGTVSNPSITFNSDPDLGIYKNTTNQMTLVAAGEAVGTVHSGGMQMHDNDIDYVHQLHFNDNVRFYDDGNDNYLNFKFGDTSYGGIKFLDGSGNLHGYFYADGDDSIGILDSGGSWAIQVDNDVITALKVNDTYRVKAHTSGVDLGCAAHTDKVRISGHLGLGDMTHPKVAYPGKNASWDGSGTTTGQIVITLPGTLAHYDMMYMEIDIYEYSSSNATKIIFGGHNWNSGGNSNTSSQQWHNTGATVLGYLDKPVYVGWRNDGSNNRRVIAIGETNSTWSYATVHVAKVHGACYYADTIDYLGDWVVAQTTSGSYFTKSPSTDFNSGFTFKTKGAIQSTNGYVQAPAFYDQDNTTYYANLAATSDNSTAVSLKVRQTVVIGDSSTYNQNDGGWGARLVVSDNVHSRIDVAQDANSMRSSWYTHTGHGGAYFGTVTSGHHQYFLAGNTQALVLNGSDQTAIFSQNVGFAGTTPSYHIDINRATNSGWLARFKNTGTAPYGIHVDTSSNASTTYTFAAYTAAEDFYIRNDGKVMIGTTTPGRMLSINGGTGNDGAVKLETTATASNFWSGVELKSPNAQSFIYMNADDSAGTIKLVPAGTVRASINATGLQLQGVLHLSNTTNMALSTNNYYLRNSSGGYYTDMGSHTAAWSHFITSSALFYFSTGISVDTGRIESYNEDMYFLRGTGGTEFARGFTGGVFKATYLSGYDGVAGGSYGRRVHIKGTGDNYLSIGCYDDNGWGYFEGINNSSGLYFNVNQGNFAFDTGDIIPYTDNEISCGGSSNRFTYVYCSQEVRSSGDVVAYYSDERLKNIHGTIPNALDKVSSLTGFYYTQNETAKELGYENDKQQVGVSAQEVQKVLPEAVGLAPVDMHYDKETKTTTSKSGKDYLTVKYEKIVPLLIESIKELKAEIEELKKCNKCENCDCK